MVLSNRDQDLLRQRLLGWGARLEPVLPGADLGQDAVLEKGPNGLDLARVSGMDNLIQDLRMALTTLVGSDIFNVAFGFDGLNAMADETEPLLVRERIRVSVVKVLQADPRVRNILDVKLLDGRLDAVHNTELDTSGMQSRTLSLRVAFETVSGDNLTVDLGKLGTNG